MADDDPEPAHRQDGDHGAGRAVVSRRTASRWAAVTVGTAAVSVVLDAVHLPSAWLFGALVVGVASALLGRSPGAPPGPVGSAGQAVIGVTIGTLVQVSTLRTIASDAAPIVLVTVATLAASVVAGLLLGLRRDVDRPTGAFAMVAGGASGLTAISQELGADARLVAVVQYLRVLLIVGSMPVVTQLVFPAGGSGSVSGAPDAVTAAGLALTAGCCLVGGALGRASRVPAGALLGPMLLAAVVEVTGLAGGATVPGWLADLAYAVIGLQVGLRFTRASLRDTRRVLPAALGLIVALVVVCAGLGLVLAPLAHVSRLDAYLATTPGGLYAVLATAVGSGADATFVLAVQVLRLLVMLLAAPLLAQVLARRGGGTGRPRSAGSPPTGQPGHDTDE